MTDKISHNQNPLLWWKYNVKKYPIVSQMARKYFSEIPTSGPYKCLFNYAGQGITKKKKKKIGYHQTDLFNYIFDFIFKRKIQRNGMKIINNIIL